MPKAKQLKEILRFEPDSPVSVTLNTDPGSAKGNTRQTQFGEKTSYTYFTKDDRVFFSSQALHDKLQKYSKGETVIITLVDGKVWTVSISGEKQLADEHLMKNVTDTESLILIRSIYEDVQTIKNHILGNDKQATVEKGTYPTDIKPGDTTGSGLPF